MARPSFTFAHLADAHVGAWARDSSVRGALRQSVLDAIRVVEERDCEFLLVSGDLFHTPVPDPSEVAPIAAGLRELARRGRRVYVVYGSHDYVAHRTSWLDVLAETGLFVRAAPEAVRAEGSRWTLPFLVDRPTGAAIAGISGRSHGLDRSYYAAVDSEAFRSHDGFRIFQFHSAVDDYLPDGMRQHIHGIARSDLPPACDYYAGGHIHQSYTGEGPGGGLLINPGAVFGTSVTDIEVGLAGRSHRGLVVVHVDDGVPSAEFVDTAPRSEMKVFNVDVAGLSTDEARRTIDGRLREESQPGALLFPRLVGTPVEGSVASLGLGRAGSFESAGAAAAVHWEISAPATVPADDAAAPGADGEIVAAAIESLLARSADDYPADAPPLSPATIRELLRALGEPTSEGEARQDYETARVDAGLRILGVRPPTTE